MYPVSFTRVSGDRLEIFAYKGEAPAEDSPRIFLALFQCNGKQCLPGKCLVDSSGKQYDFLKTPLRILGKTLLAQ